MYNFAVIFGFSNLSHNRLWEGVAIVAIYMLYIQIIAPAPRILDAMREIESEHEGMKVCPCQGYVNAEMIAMLTTSLESLEIRPPNYPRPYHNFHCLRSRLWSHLSTLRYMEKRAHNHYRLRLHQYSLGDHRDYHVSEEIQTPLRRPQSFAEAHGI